MADKNIFKLEGKSQEQVKEAFLEFLKIDKTKPGGYASVGSNKVICKVAKEACGVNSVLEIKKAEDAREVSKLLTGRIDEELDYGKRHQMTSLRCHVRNMTERFLSEEAREGIQINAIKEQTKALKEVAKKPTIQAEHYHAGNSTFDVHSKHLHLDHQEEGNSALLPSEL